MFEDSNFTKVNSLKRVTYTSFLIKTLFVYFKYNDLFHASNVYLVPGKEHQVSDFLNDYDTSLLEVLFWKCLEYVPLILRN